MSREAMKLALGVLSGSWRTEEEKNALREKQIQAVIALREALAKPDFWEGYVPEPVKPATTETNGGKTGWPPGLLQDDCKGLSKWLSNKPDAKRRVREALDKMAENARELGLDYEPAQDSGVVTAGGFDPRTQRTWVGLTDEERKLVRNSVGYNQFVTAGEYAEHVQKATEFKLLEKNT